MFSRLYTAGRAQTPSEIAYTGPYQVLQRVPKYFAKLLGRKIDRIFIDRLKPARLLICTDGEADINLPEASN